MVYQYLLNLGKIRKFQRTGELQTFLIFEKGKRDGSGN